MKFRSADHSQKRTLFCKGMRRKVAVIDVIERFNRVKLPRRSIGRCYVNDLFIFSIYCSIKPVEGYASLVDMVTSLVRSSLRFLLGHFFHRPS